MDKSAEELGAILQHMYETAPRGKQVTMVHLFGIQYRHQIEKVGLKDVITASGIRPTYLVEVNKGMNLGDFVTINSKK